MSATILLFYASHHGHTEELVCFLREKFGIKGVLCLPFDLGKETPLIFTIAPIWCGFHLAPVTLFLRQHKQRLSQKLLALTSINLTTRKPEKNTAPTRFDTNENYTDWKKLTEFASGIAVLYRRAISK